MAEWPAYHSRELDGHAADLGEAIEEEDVLAALRAVAGARRSLRVIEANLLAVAADETTLSQRALASMLGVSASTLRGLRARTKAGGR